MIIGFGPTLFFKAISPGPTSDWPESAVVLGKSTTAAIVSFSSASKVVLQLFVSATAEDIYTLVILALLANLVIQA